MSATSVSGSTSPHMPSRLWIALSIARRWWSENSVGTMLPSALHAADPEATGPHRDTPPPAPSPRGQRSGHKFEITIGEVARRANVRASAIRYYEQVGLL